MAMGYSALITCVFSQIINSWPNKRLLNYNYIEQLKDILPGILLAVFMFVCIYPIQCLNLSDFIILLIQIPLGIVIFITGSVILKLEAFMYLWQMMQPLLTKLVKKGQPQ